MTPRKEPTPKPGRIWPEPETTPRPEPPPAPPGRGRPEVTLDQRLEDEKARVDFTLRHVDLSTSTLEAARVAAEATDDLRRRAASFDEQWRQTHSDERSAFRATHQLTKWEQLRDRAVVTMLDRYMEDATSVVVPEPDVLEDIVIAADNIANLGYPDTMEALREANEESE